MADGNPSVRSRFAAENQALAQEWRRLSRAATFVAILTLPAVFIVLYVQHDWPLGWAIIVSILAVAAFRGLVDLITHRMIPRASLYGAGRERREEDATARRRLWYWKHKYKVLIWLAIIFGIPLAVIWMISGSSPSETISKSWDFLSNPQIYPTLLILGLQIPLLFLANILILFGPMLFFSVRQMRGYEPGDADWGVSLDDVRGQAEPKQEVERVISLWQSSEEFRKAGGKPERGLLFLGQPGTGKTMLSKAIATSFNSPIITFPGSGFGAMFIGLDALIVQILLTKARRLARKWGGQCIVFIDEIDAVGMRRQALQGGGGGRWQPPAMTPQRITDLCFYGPNGALTASGDVVIESRAWRDRLFSERYPRAVPRPPGLYGRIMEQ